MVCSVAVDGVTATDERLGGGGGETVIVAEAFFDTPLSVALTSNVATPASSPAVKVVESSSELRLPRLLFNDHS
jgi:hypothetical protein